MVAFRKLTDFSIEFCALVTEYRWLDKALKRIFYQALSEEIKDALAMCDDAKDLEKMTQPFRLMNGHVWRRHDCPLR